MDKVTVALISAVVSFLATLVAVCVRWGLSNISDESKHIREERLTHQKRLEDKYTEILVAMELSIRSSNLNNDDKLANANAIVSLLGSSEVTSKFQAFSETYRKYDKKIRSEGKFGNFLDARFEYEYYWCNLIKAYQALSKEMRSHIKSYDQFNVRN
ncbi:TPA: hypothetical protein RQK97_004383 [Vibrio vulnificus]|nr:hypothetical protein [Vibrio vulnificus]HAU8262173.1 hypothetical protein [Vibrio vulnificus]HDY8109332.1 hypothetical protein [Vibrio vulnificus]